MGVVDLAEIKKRADERDALEAEAAERAELLWVTERAAQWDKAMTRAFKGICPAPERRTALNRAARRLEQET